MKITSAIITEPDSWQLNRDLAIGVKAANNQHNYFSTGIYCF